MRRGTLTEVALVSVEGHRPPVAHVGGPYRVTGDDPLSSLSDAWVARWAKGDEAAFEVAAQELLGRRPELPDYYLVAGAVAVDGGPFEPTVLKRHFYLGLLHGLRPGRVAPGDDVVEGIRSLGAAPWWPDLAELVAAARAFRADAVT